MLIVGAKGHAVEVLQSIATSEQGQIVFFDNITLNLPDTILGKYSVLRTTDEAKAYLTDIDNRFILGIGGPLLRQQLGEQFQKWGGEMTSVIASTAIVGPFAKLGNGLNLMHHTLVAPTASVGDGVLLNAGAAIHHDSIVGAYCEISPGARILGRCELGSGCRIGALAVILPDIKVGAGAIIGAGAVVTRSVAAGATVVGVPARAISYQNSSFNE